MATPYVEHPHLIEHLHDLLLLLLLSVFLGEVLTADVLDHLLLFEHETVSVGLVVPPLVVQFGGKFAFYHAFELYVELGQLSGLHRVGLIEVTSEQQLLAVAELAMLVECQVIQKDYVLIAGDVYLGFEVLV